MHCLLIRPRQDSNLRPSVCWVRNTPISSFSLPTEPSVKVSLHLALHYSYLIRSLCILTFRILRYMAYFTEYLLVGYSIFTTFGFGYLCGVPLGYPLNHILRIGTQLLIAYPLALSSTHRMMSSLASMELAVAFHLFGFG